MPENLLDEERVSHAARYALEGMPYPEAIAALRNALGVTTGPLKAGLIDSLGWRRDPAAVPLLEPLLRGSDTMLAAAAASALGRIGGPAALAALLTARDRGPAAVQAAVRDGLLQNGEHLVAEGKAAEATALYQKLVVPTESEQVRAAAYAGLIRASGPHALPLVAAALEGNDPMSQTAVLQLASDLTPTS